MPYLLIRRVNDIWEAGPANSGISFVFKSLDGTQEIAMQQFAAAMSEGEAAVIQSVEEVFDLPSGLSSDSVVGTLFKTTDGLILESRPIFSAFGEDTTLLDEIELAGEVLERELLFIV